MINLVIDTCNSNLVIALIKNKKILSIFNEQLNMDLSTKIFPVMQDVFAKAKISPNDVDSILVANGPGSFTGIRIGVTIAKTYALVLNKKITTFSSLELMATTKTNKKYIVPIIDARREYVYAGIYDEKLNKIMNDCYININDLLEQLKNKSYIFVSYDDFDKLETINPELNILKIINLHENDKGLNPHEVNPTYLKLTEAEMKYKNND